MNTTGTPRRLAANFRPTALQAIVLFTNALEFDPTDHVFWSNRRSSRVANLISPNLISRNLI